ncbi:MAG: hypothetical protein DWI69_13440 [Chloroflexi bacterium]|nr:MAG: hypothetical protein DWI69_13440 [Chloroflexota bacterium]
MPRTIRITAGNVTMDATLNETATASEIWDALPITARANIWGDEIYFAIPVHRAEENAKATVGLGDLGYWPPGNAFCIFYGPTPMSRGDEIRPASPVNIVGKVVGDAKEFKQVSSGTKVTITEA